MIAILFIMVVVWNSVTNRHWVQKPISTIDLSSTLKLVLVNSTFYRPHRGLLYMFSWFCIRRNYKRFIEIWKSSIEIYSHLERRGWRRSRRKAFPGRIDASHIYQLNTNADATSNTGSTRCINSYRLCEKTPTRKSARQLRYKRVSIAWTISL